MKLGFSYPVHCPLQVKKKKMAEQTRIKVAVIEGDYAELCALGLPLALSLQLQCLNLQLSGALWSARASASGFSVSLYWPTAPGSAVTNGEVAMKVKKARKWRKHKRKQASATSKTTTPLVTTYSKSQSQLITASPNKEHPSPVSDTRQSTDRPLTDDSALPG